MSKQAVRAYHALLRQVKEARTYFDLLGVSADSSEEELGKARRALARELHPDVNGDPAAAGLMAEVNAAHATRVDPVLRKRYMATLSQKECPTCRGLGVCKKQKGFKGVEKLICTDCHGSGRERKLK